jgi:hypothetical protein
MLSFDANIVWVTDSVFNKMSAHARAHTHAHTHRHARTNNKKISIISATNPAGVLQSVQCLTIDWATWVRSPAEAKDFSSSICVQTSSEAQPSSHPMATRDPFPGIKWAVSWRWPLTQYSAMVKAIPPLLLGVCRAVTGQFHFTLQTSHCLTTLYASVYQPIHVQSDSRNTLYIPCLEQYLCSEG